MDPPSPPKKKIMQQGECDNDRRFEHLEEHLGEGLFGVVFLVDVDVGREKIENFLV